MAKVYSGRYTAEVDDSVVVFLIGVRINRLLAIHKWLPVVLAMGPMIAELMKDKDSGLVGVRTMLSGRGVTVLQYWRSFEALHAYAHQKNGLHPTAWSKFNRSIGNDGSVGIWHETYLIDRGQSECVYVNMPALGLPAATRHVPVGAKRDSARARLEA
jgi:Domain of unknown function (DUF4188)